MVNCMCLTKEDVYEVLKADAIANRRKSLKARFFGDEIWKFILALRWYEYYLNMSSKKRKIHILQYAYWRYRYHQMGIRCGFSIAPNVAGPGFGLPHYGTIVINGSCRIGKNCRVHTGVNIGATNGSSKAAIIGNNVYIAPGVKIVGNVTITDDVAIGAGAVVVKDILEPGTTWGGVPAKKISNNNSHSNLPKELFE